jgi:uncharacterized protein (DUF305 family)
MKRVRTVPTAAVAVAVAVVTALALAACGDSGPTTQHSSSPARGTAAPTTSSAPHNAADVTFAQTMIPHHRQALQMAELARTRATNPKVEELAVKIQAEQQPEIQTMTAWLQAWGAPIPDMSGGMGHGSSGGMGHGSMPGMMTDADMGTMKTASGAAFDRMFLTMMIAHHEGAVQMAETENAQGQNPGAKALAKRVETTQRAEIAEMQALLKTLG